MSVSKKVNHLLREYDLFIQKYGLFKEIYLLSLEIGTWDAATGIAGLVPGAPGPREHEDPGEAWAQYMYR